MGLLWTLFMALVGAPIIAYSHYKANKPKEPTKKDGE